MAVLHKGGCHSRCIMLLRTHFTVDTPGKLSFRQDLQRARPYLQDKVKTSSRKVSVGPKVVPGQHGFNVDLGLSYST